MAKQTATEFTGAVTATSFIGDGSALTGLGRTVTKTVGPTGTGSDYTTDGTADNVEIQAAIDAVNAAGGGTVYLKPGTYTLAAIVNLKANVWLQGAGYATRIVQTSNYTLKVSGINNVRITDIRTDASGMTAGNYYSIYCENCQNVRVERCRIENAAGFGIFFTANASNVTSDIWIVDNYISGLGTSDVIGGGPANSTGAVVRDVFVQRNIVKQDSTVANHHPDAINFVGVYRVSFTNNTVEGSILFGSEQYPHKYGQISGNIVKAGNGAARAAVGLVLDSAHPQSGEGVSITNNVVERGFIDVYSNPTAANFKNLTLTNNTVYPAGISTSLGEAAIVVVNNHGATIANNNVCFNSATASIVAASDVNASTDTITETAHGLITSEPVLYTAGTATIAGLTTNTTYYVIRVDANSFKLATSKANAWAGTAIDLTSTGTGTHTIVSAFADAIWLRGGSNNHISGNTMKNAPSWGYKEDNSSDNNFVIANTFLNNTLGTVTGAGANTVIYSNKGDTRSVPVSYGGTGASTVSAARTSLGVQSKTFVTVGTADADYITDGTADNVEIQAAINSFSAGTSGTVYLKEGTYVISAALTFGTRKIKLVGAGQGRTIIQAAAAFSSFAMIYEFTSGAGNIELADITWDANSVNGKGVIEMGVVNNVYIHNCEFKNVASPSTSHWTVLIGSINNADIAGSASNNIVFTNNYVHDNGNGTNETILPINVRNSRFDNNYFANNTNSAFTLNLFGYCYNTTVNGNIFRNCRNPIYLLSCDTITIENNANYAESTSQDIIVISNSHNVVVNGNVSHGYRSGGSASGGIRVSDRVGTFDGHAQLHTGSKYVTISNNQIYDAYTGISIAGGDPAGIFNGYTTQDIHIIGNQIFATEWQGIAVGRNTTGLDIKNIVIENNYVGISNMFDVGAIAIVGDSTSPDITKVKDITIRNNKVLPSARSNAAGIELNAVSDITVVGNDLTGTAKGTLISDALYIRNGATTRQVFNNQGWGSTNEIAGSLSAAGVIYADNYYGVDNGETYFGVPPGTVDEHIVHLQAGDGVDGETAGSDLYLRPGQFGGSVKIRYTSGREIAFNMDGVSTSRSLIFPDADVNLGDIANKSDVGHAHNASDISASGTASATTYLRGDNTWATPLVGSSKITTASSAPSSPTTGDLWVDTA